MKRQSNIGRTIVIGILVLVVVIGGYALFVGLPKTGTNQLTSLVTAPATEESDKIRAELYALLAEMQDLRIDSAIFSDPRFAALIDWSVPISPQPVGRPNPFLPIGVND